MSLFKRIFGNGDPLASLRKALQQKRWADALVIGERLDRAALGADAAAELDSLMVAAGDGLAELNLTEGEACLRSGEVSRAAEHFSLAAAQVRSESLAQRIAQARAQLTPHSAPDSTPPPAPAHSCGPTCSSAGVAASPEGHNPPTAEDLDPQTRLELVLASYPPEWAPRYGQISGTFREAFLLAHEGREREALDRFAQIPAEERDDLFYFERGALLGRLGENERGCKDLEKAIELNPDHLLAMETLITMEIAGGQDAAAQKRLNRMLERGVAPAFCHGRLTAIFARRGDLEGALQHGRRAVEEGNEEPDTLLLVASLLEQAGYPAEAEKLLMRFPGGGCSGGASVPLAELWLRQGKNLDKALEAFKGALRQEPGRPRWPLRIAQTYLARGWKKEGMALLEKALADPHLEPELHREGMALLHSCRQGKNPGSP